MLLWYLRRNRSLIATIYIFNFYSVFECKKKVDVEQNCCNRLKKNKSNFKHRLTKNSH